MNGYDHLIIFNIQLQPFTSCKWEHKWAYHFIHGALTIIDSWLGKGHNCSYGESHFVQQVIEVAVDFREWLQFAAPWAPGPWISEPRWKDEMQWMWTKSKSWCYIMNLQSFSGRRGLGCKTMISPCLRLTSTAFMLNRHCIFNVVLNIKCGH